VKQNQEDFKNWVIAL